MRSNAFFASLPLGFVLVGCPGSDETDTDVADTDVTDTDVTDTDVADTDVTDTDVEEPPVLVRMINNVWDKTEFNMRVEGAGADLPGPLPQGANTGYTDIFDPGTYGLLVHEGDAKDPFLTVSGIAVEAGGAYTIVAYGVGAYAGITVTDDISAPTAGSYRATIINTNPAAGELDVSLAKTDLWTAVAYGATGDATEIAEGEITLTLTTDVGIVDCTIDLSADAFVADWEHTALFSVLPSPIAPYVGLFAYMNGQYVPADKVTGAPQVPVMGVCVSAAS